MDREAVGLVATSFGDRLRAAMGRAGLSSEAVGREVGVSGAAVRKWTLSKSEPDLQTLSKLARVTGVSPVWLLEGDQAPPEVRDWVVAFADLVHAGVSPEAALAVVTGGRSGPSAREARQLAAAAGAMRSLLDLLAPAPWPQLSLEQKRAVLGEVEEMVRRSRWGLREVDAPS